MGGKGGGFVIGLNNVDLGRFGNGRIRGVKGINDCGMFVYDDEIG